MADRLDPTLASEAPVTPLVDDLEAEAETFASAAEAGPKDAERDVERLRDDIESLRRDFANLTDTLRGLAMARGEEGAAVLRDYAQQARGQTQEYVSEAEEAISRNPLLSVAAAAGVGYILGRLMDRD